MQNQPVMVNVQPHNHMYLESMFLLYRGCMTPTWEVMTLGVVCQETPCYQHDICIYSYVYTAYSHTHLHRYAHPQMNIYAYRHACTQYVHPRAEKLIVSHICSHSSMMWERINFEYIILATLFNYWHLLYTEKENNTDELKYNLFLFFSFYYTKRMYV